MVRLFFLLLLLLPALSVAEGAVQLALEGQPPVTLNEVYHRNGVVYLAVDEVLPILGLSGSWDSVKHIYSIKTPFGRAQMSPGSQFLRLGGQFQPLTNSPSFIDGRLRVDENFVVIHLPALLNLSVYYRDLDPSVEQMPTDSSLDRLFSFLLRKQKPAGVKGLRAVAIDPAHGGADPGSMGPKGLKEKDLVLSVAQGLQKRFKMHLGLPVYLSRDADYSLTAAQRFAAVNKPEVDALVLLHAQAALSESARGAVLFIRPQEQKAADEGGDSMALARQLRQALRQAGIEVAAIERAPLLPLGQGDLPTVLVELGYLSNSTDRELLGQSAGQERLAEALYRGLKAFAHQQQEIE
jgi:N-acetylmuramoyl-L-alanine amidase